MPTEPSNLTRSRRKEELKFAYAGPFVSLLNPIRSVNPERDAAGDVLAKQPRYMPTGPESWTIGARMPAFVALALVAAFGREYGSVLDDEPAITDETIAAPKPKRRRRRGSRGGRKPVTT